MTKMVINMKQKGSTLLIVLSIIFGLIIVGGGVWYWKTKIYIPNKEQQNTQPSTQQSLIATSTQDATANWKTYKNDFFGFGFKYPPEYNVDDRDLMEGSIEGKHICSGRIYIKKGKDEIITLAFEHDLTSSICLDLKPECKGIEECKPKTFEECSRCYGGTFYTAGGATGDINSNINSLSPTTTLNGISGYELFNKLKIENKVSCNPVNEVCTECITEGWCKSERREELIGPLYLLNVTPYITSEIKNSCSYNTQPGPFVGFGIFGSINFINAVGQEEYVKVVEGIVNSLKFQK